MIFDLHISHGYKIDNYSIFVDSVFNGKDLAKDFTVLIDYDQEDYYALSLILSMKIKYSALLCDYSLNMAFR